MFALAPPPPPPPKKKKKQQRRIEDPKQVEHFGLDSSASLFLSRSPFLSLALPSPLSLSLSLSLSLALSFAGVMAGGGGILETRSPRTLPNP